MPVPGPTLRRCPFFPWLPAVSPAPPLPGRVPSGLPSQVGTGRRSAIPSLFLFWAETSHFQFLPAPPSRKSLYPRVVSVVEWAEPRRKMAAPAAAAEPQASGGLRPPACLLVLGMAGSGKTTFVQVMCMARAQWVCARGCGRPGKRGGRLSEELEGTGAWLSGTCQQPGFLLGGTFSDPSLG